jgi:prepilin-type N-terminal cleavage/methylation domain-containing protein
MSLHSFQKLKGFTLTEIMLVVIILSIMLVFAVPNYRKTVDRAHLQDAINQLTAIHAANQIYRAQTGTQFLKAASPLTLSDINLNLGLNVIANGMTYTYLATNNANVFTVRAALGSTYTVEVNESAINSPLAGSTDPSANPKCSGGAACP